MDLDTLKQLLTEFKNEISENMNEKISQMSEDFKNILGEFKETIKKQKDKINFLEREVRKRNLIIHGIKENDHPEKSLEDLVLTIINNKLQIQLKEEDIEFVRRVGKKINQKVMTE